MEVKALLSTSLFISLLVFNPDCGLRGVDASPVSKNIAKQLDSLRAEYPAQTAVVRISPPSAEKFSNTETEFGEVRITGEIYESEDPISVTMSVVHLNGSKLYSLYSMTTWHSGKGEVSFVSGGVGYDRWSIRWEIPRLVSATIEIKVVVYTEVSQNIHLPSQHIKKNLSSNMSWRPTDLRAVKDPQLPKPELANLIHLEGQI
jgi:hypothetical protein